MKRGATRGRDFAGTSPSRNIRLVLAYDGTAFHGWQRQSGLRTVQASLEEALAKLTGEPVKLVGSGRTDAGVHALGQVANFGTSCPIPTGNLKKALNDALTNDIRVLEAEEASPRFHARYDARSKLYRYKILLSAVCPPFICRYVWHCPYPLDRRPMARAAQIFLGEHDFTSFAASGQPDDVDGSAAESSRKAKSMIRAISSSKLFWSERRRVLAYEVEGSGFLHHMVRNIVGTLVEVGRGAMEPDDVHRILLARDRTQAGPTAPAQGLYLVRANYPESS